MAHLHWIILLTIGCALFLPALGDAAAQYTEDCTSESACLADTVTIGMLAPTSGGADRYGNDIVEAARLAESDFNYYLTQMGANWSLELRVLDSQTDPSLVLGQIRSLNEAGISIVGGPSIDIITDQMLDYATDQDMLLLSCCSALPSRAIAQDALFRLISDHRYHASAIAELISMHDIRAVVMVGQNAPWITELLEHTKIQLESEFGIDVPRVLTYSIDSMDVTAANLAYVVERHADLHGHQRVAVMYAGFEENVDFVRHAASHDILGKVQWFGADINTMEPNIADSHDTRRFAIRTDMLVVQPSVPDSVRADRIEMHVQEQTGIPASPYAHFGYDVVWLLGLSIMGANSTHTSTVAEALPHAVAEYDSVSGLEELNKSGDSVNGTYAVWEMRSGGWKDVTYDYWPETLSIGAIVLEIGNARIHHNAFAIQTAVDDFNDYLKSIGIREWVMSVTLEESQSNPEVALSKVRDLHENGINFIVGPPTSASVMAIQDYVQDHGLSIVSCCSTSPELAAIDNIFRLAPSDAQQGAVIANMLHNDGKSLLIPVWVDDPFGRGLVNSTAANFDGHTVLEFPDAGYTGYVEGSRSLTHAACTNEDATCDGQFGPLISELNRIVVDAMRVYGPHAIAIQYVGANLDDLVRVSLDYDALRLVSWVGSDADTLEPRLVDDPDVLKFLVDVGFKSTIFEADTASPRFVQLTDDLTAMYPGETYSTYDYSSYDAVWAIGLAAVEAGGHDTTLIDIPAAVQSNTGGALGSISLNEYGDLDSANYAIYGIMHDRWQKIGTFDTDRRYVQTSNPPAVDIGMLLDMSGMVGFRDLDFATVMAMARQDYEGPDIRLVEVDTRNGILPALNMLHWGTYDSFYRDRLYDTIQDAISQYSEADGFAAINDQYDDSQFYPLVINSQGIVIAHGHNSEIIGDDADGVVSSDRLMRDTFAIFEGDDPPKELWWQYVFYNPLTSKEEVKRTLLVYHSESGHIVGSGYHPALDRIEDVMRDTIHQAVLRITADGGTDISVLADTFDYDTAPTPFYVFVADKEGNVLVSAAHNNLNSNIDTLPGIDTTTQEILQELAETDGLWIDYEFNNPATDIQEQKRTLLMLVRIGESEYIFGAGYYPPQFLSHFVGPTTSRDADLVLDYINDNGLVVVSPSSTAPALAIPGDGLFRLRTSDAYQTLALTDMLKADSKTHIVMVSRDDVWGRGFVTGIAAGNFTTYGIDTLLVPVGGAVDYDSIARDIEYAVDLAINDAGSADNVAVLYAVFDNELVRLFNSLDTARVSYYGGTTVNSPVVTDDPVASRIASEAGFSAVAFDVAPNEINLSLQERLGRIGVHYDSYAASAYDAVHMLANALAGSGTITSGHNGALNEIVLDEAGDLMVSWYDVWRVVDGQWVNVGRYDIPTGQ